MNQTTDWFNGHEYVPGQPGVYERFLFSKPLFSYWDGELWYAYSDSVDAAFRNYKRKWASNYQALPFRGLKDEPNK